MTTTPPIQRLTALRGVPIFSGLAKPTLFEINRRARQESHPAGTMLIREGGCNHAVSIMLSGRADVQQEGQRIRSIGPGDYFGELCIIDGSPYEADVVATADVELLIVDGSDFDALLRIPQVARAVMVGLARRIRDLGPGQAQRRPTGAPETCDTCGG